MSPAALLPKLKASLTSQSALMRTTVVTAMKFTISDQPQPIDQLLRAEIGHFLTTLRWRKTYTYDLYCGPTTQGSWSECEESCFGGFQLGCTQQAESDQGSAQRGSSSGAWELKVPGVKPVLPETLPSYIMRHRRERSWSVKLRWDPSNMKLMMDLIFARWGFGEHFIFFIINMELHRPRLSACTLSWTPALTGSCTTGIAISWPFDVYETVTNLRLRLDIFEFLSHVQDGLKDHYDIKMLTYLMVARLPSTVV